jgi:hypothetical protein
MAHLWLHAGEAWLARPLEDDVVALVPGDALELRPADPSERERAAALVVRARSENGEETWALVTGAGAGAVVNGQPLPHPVHRLRHQDEIALDGQAPFHFATDEPARIVAYEGGAKGLFCPRCRKPINPGQPIVRCPKCRTPFHQIEGERPCWTYAPACLMCQHATKLTGDYAWRPDHP